MNTIKVLENNYAGDHDSDHQSTYFSKILLIEN